MAVKEITETSWNQSVDERAKVCRRECAGVECDHNEDSSERIDEDACGLKTVPRKQSRKRVKDDESNDGPCDIDDREVSKYLNSKEEIFYKRIMWEAVYGAYTKPKKQKQPTKRKKGISGKKDVRTKDVVEAQRPSSKINYDALKRLNDELDKVSEAAQVVEVDSARTEDGSSNGKGYYQEENDQDDHEHHYDDEYLDFW